MPVMGPNDPNLHDRAERFRALHDSGIFVMPCAWDAGSARLFEAAGFDAIGTTSGGVNWSAGRSDYVYAVERAVMLAEYGAIAAAVDLPVSGDLENGYGMAPDEVAETVRASVEHGMVGGSIEDQDPGPGPGLIPIELAVERIVAAREAADATGVLYTLTARAESYFGGVPDPFDDAVERANRYAAAGADCIFVPGPDSLETIASLVDAVDAPISVGLGSGGDGLSVAALASVGVRRISTGGLLPRAIAALVDRAATEMRSKGTFTFGREAMSGVDLNEFYGG